MLGNAIPSGFPTLTFPAIPLADYLRLLPSALAIVAILLCEGLLVVRSYTSKYDYKADGDQMLFAWGAANLAAGFTGSLLTGNSPSRSAAMDASGSQQPAPQPGRGRDDRRRHALLHRHAGVPAQRGAGRDRGQRGAVADRGPRAARAVADAPLGVLDRRRLPAERAGAGAAARRPHRLPPLHDRRHPAGVPPGHRGPRGGARRQPLLPRGRRAGIRELRASSSTGSAPRSTSPTGPCSSTRSSRSGPARPAPSGGSCWMRRRWWTSTRPARRP